MKKINFKKAIIISIVVILISVLGTCLTLYALIMSVPLLIFNILPDPPKPEIVYSEFPFEIVIKMSDETIEIKDIFICEYDGISANTGVGKYREWKGYVKGTKDHAILLKEDDGKKFYCSVGSPEVYMDDYDSGYDDNVINKPTVYCVEITPDSTSTHYFNESEMKAYGIEIISYKFSEPIDNTFK